MKRGLLTAIAALAALYAIVVSWRQNERAAGLDFYIYYVNAHNAVRRRDSRNPQWAWLRKNRGDFDREPQDPAKNIEIIATGRGSWKRRPSHPA